jgi:hypothetical protein
MWGLLDAYGPSAWDQSSKRRLNDFEKRKTNENSAAKCEVAERYRVHD